MDLKYPLSSKMKAGDKAMDWNVKMGTKGLKTYGPFTEVFVMLQ